jgi:hypothetical protein
MRDGGRVFASSIAVCELDDPAVDEDIVALSSDAGIEIESCDLDSLGGNVVVVIYRTPPGRVHLAADAVHWINGFRVVQESALRHRATSLDAAAMADMV